ncbi:MAG: 1,6-anhydro-N-acetylmuramyl-L-alanine amidase AmpD [Gammaproteobacteria bacterium]|nr:1,6-anhydro-N-acetylmuramyl-L-alanine amidase AmpD [Gammaproteobacteria bacterium]MCW8927885.1 1,6-anhydro-N-acetylmuramyl-L-alanine amidase AmpD [Gammaproteobacteria bacterium]MCW8958142.1 1,6-anhydro-N-acetylmuramyl-L-alanine amidase AmpD [Gammaproteobacteria bacterium]MCW8973869.1 1,6-anhydro-N-acetylmuramyl-L-alanine amidase AmpD [Gammaproteobacteria bacterium]MCW8993972.1 1,6-anhydro-N-acetylmuramyl-L-alanine amidase AmpD [Gammaproteobacteria bacterium]
MSLRVDTTSGLIAPARQVASPNCDERPSGSELELIVIHNISLPPHEYGGPWIDALFTNTLDPEAHPYFAEICQLRVSAHLLIRRDGELVQYVPFHQRAWHAGVSRFEGRERCNDFSVGIELEGSDDEPYEPVQYRVLSEVIAALEQAYPALNRHRLAGHSDIAPGRKSDPGPAFEWNTLYAELSGKPKRLA